MPEAPPKLQPALFGGLFIGVLSALPLINIGNCCCLWVIGGGTNSSVAVSHAPNATVPNGSVWRASMSPAGGCLGGLRWRACGSRRANP